MHMARLRRLLHGCSLRCLVHLLYISRDGQTEARSTLSFLNGGLDMLYAQSGIIDRGSQIELPRVIHML